MFIVDAYVKFLIAPALVLMALLWFGWWFAIPAGLLAVYLLLRRVEASAPPENKDGSPPR